MSFSRLLWETIVIVPIAQLAGAGFVTSVMLVIAYLRAVFGVDLAGEIKNRAARLTVWSALLACQLVVLGSSANAFDTKCDEQVEDIIYCRRAKYGISVGAIGTAMSLGVVGMKMVTALAPFVVESAIAVFLCIMNGFGVALLTSAKGPGSPIGNLYYFTWLSFITNVMIVANVYDDYRNAGAAPQTTQDGDVEVENMDQGI